MTKARAPASFEDAVIRVVDRIGWSAAAAAVGWGEKVVRNMSDPDLDRLPTLKEAIALDAAFLAAGGGEPPLMAVYQQMLDRSVSPPSGTAELLTATAKMAQETGEAVAFAVQAAQPGASDFDRQRALRELDEAAEAIAVTRRRLGGPALTVVSGGQS